MSERASAEVMPADTIPSTKLLRHPERSVLRDIADILLASKVAHVGIIENEWPVVIPMTYAFNPETPDVIYIHGSQLARILGGAATNARVCVTVTELTGLVYSKTALNHSMIYRSVVAFGRMRIVDDAETKSDVFRRMIGRYFDGRSEGRDYSAPTLEHLAMTKVVAVDVIGWSAKSRAHGAAGPGDDDPSVLGTSGVQPL
ncbi:MAG TPA: pyridoxamine 5'-phosphate oxidase family protein [Candidatus Eremiobacteraceae bacterium]|nr:pyridoxamine 5'-phosphate oxidase family protein [Candidatus Eremiobacteraceae bacterium]